MWMCPSSSRECPSDSRNLQQSNAKEKKILFYEWCLQTIRLLSTTTVFICLPFLFDWLPLSDWPLSRVISGNNNRALAQRLHGHSAPQSSWRTSTPLFTPPRRFRSSRFLSVSHAVSFPKVPIMLLAGVFGISSVPRSFAEKSVLNYSACVLCWRCEGTVWSTVKRLERGRTHLLRCCCLKHNTKPRALQALISSPARASRV